MLEKVQLEHRVNKCTDGMNTDQLYSYKYETECDEARKDLRLFMGKGTCIVHMFIHIDKSKYMISEN